jgi:hypothetical protein
LASLPFAYVFSFAPRTSIIGFTNFFIVNVIANVIDAVINSFTIFSRNEQASAGPSRTYTAVNNFRSILAALLPSVNLKHALSNSQLHENGECVAIFNTFIGTKLNVNEVWTSMSKPGVGTQMLLFCLQTLVWTLLLIVVENRRRRQLLWERIRGKRNDGSSLADQASQWNDSVCLVGSTRNQ